MLVEPRLVGWTTACDVTAVTARTTAVGGDWLAVGSRTRLITLLRSVGYLTPGYCSPCNYCHWLIPHLPHRFGWFQFPALLIPTVRLGPFHHTPPHMQFFTTFRTTHVPTVGPLRWFITGQFPSTVLYSHTHYLRLVRHICRRFSSVPVPHGYLHSTVTDG